MELTHIRLLVYDFEQTFKFYRDLIGLKPQADTPQGPYAKFSFAEGAAAISLQQRSHFIENSVPLRERSSGLAAGTDNALIAIRVASVAEEVERLRQSGAEVTGPRDLFGRMTCAWLRDPEGNLIELQEWVNAGARKS
ncbi:MAG TPA: VOC family protein [Polyangiaceae bacterium]|nr:VOC family protein [Polyangiaceae bacterium]